jgi:hypothetical protein
MVIVLVHWLIKPGCEDAFKERWKQMTIDAGKGLYREFLTEPMISNDPKFNTFSITDCAYSTFINIGFWKSLDDFDRLVGKYIPDPMRIKDPKDLRQKDAVLLDGFEFKIREGIVLQKIRDRDGGDSLPPADL